ncbi:MAG: sensor histidine kinase [Gemmatimonadota bacterium]
MAPIILTLAAPGAVGGHDDDGGPGPGPSAASSTAAAASPGRWGRREWVLAFLAVATAIGLLRFGYKFLEARLRDPSTPALPALVDELTAALAAGLLFAAAVPLIVGHPLTRGGWARRLPGYLAGTIAFSLAHTGLNAVSRWSLYPLLGLGAYDYGSPALRIPMELANDVVFFGLFVGLVHGFLWYRGLKDREVGAARLEAALDRARVANLRDRLHPHFLFNTLNAISSEMYRDVEAADRMISRLSDLLRAALESGHEQETTLDGELALLDAYLEIVRLRFGERLDTRIEVEDAARDALVPVLLLQPLVENAVEHAVAERAGPAEIVVRARVVESGRSVPGGERERGDPAGQVLRIEVLDDGPGLVGDPSEALRAGIGLSTTAARLRHLHGDAAALSIENRAPTGVRVAVTLPFRAAAPAQADVGAGPAPPASTEAPTRPDPDPRPDGASTRA